MARTDRMDARRDCLLALFGQEYSLNGDRSGEKIERGMKDRVRRS